jgi:hypothetical protein
MVILSLCREEHHWKLIPGYAAALGRRGIQFVCPEEPIVPNAPLESFLRACPQAPTWIFHFECNRPILPEGLLHSEIPTVYFDVDTYAYTHRRMRWDSLFDHVAVFHPGYDDQFRRAGHPGAFLLPHAVRREFFDEPEIPRELEVGWVGQTNGPLYQKRAAWLPKLASLFRTNDWSRPYTLEEVADVYRRSLVVVNIGRDDFPRDANMRVFEVLASGALLITKLPNELSELGFQEGVHFVGYREEREIIPLIRVYLTDETARLRITQAARAKVLQEHTYDSRVEQLLGHLERAGSAELAPARHWPEHRVRLMYLDFFAAVGLFNYCQRQFQHIVGSGFRETLEGAILLGKAWIRNRRGPYRNEY